jgi:ELWxxDGT repeat protein
VQIDQGAASAASGHLSSAASELATTSQLHAIAARAIAAALQAGAPGTPVSITASALDAPRTRSAALSTGGATAFAFKILLLNPPQPVTNPLTGVAVLANQGADVALGIGPASSSAIPPALGIIVRDGTQVFTATQGQESATLATTGNACTGVAISGLTCDEATFSSAGLVINASAPIAGGATGSPGVALGTGNLWGVSLRVDCSLTTLCGPPVNPGPARLFFAADDGVHGLELWGTDGTPGGTVMIKDIHPTASSNPIGFTTLGDFTYFTANDGTHGNELWKTDGTAANTAMVMDINPGAASSSPAELTVVGSELFFTAQAGANGRQIWKTDGTAANTQVVSNVPTLISASSLQAFHGAVYFRGRTVAHGFELWKADSSGVAEVVDLNPDAGHGLNCQGGFTEYNDALYFSADNGTTGCELWRSDGTANETKLVMDINPGPTGTNVFNLTVVGNILFFSANTPESGLELWRTNGTPTGTSMVKDIVPGAGSPGPAYFTALSTPSGNELLFSCLYPGGSMLCASDGTAAGTISLGQPPAVPGTTKGLTTALGKVFFQAQGGHTSGTSDGAELWVTDGTNAGTVQLKDINPGGNGSFPTLFRPVGNKVVFEATTDATGNELWVTDGTPGNTTLLKDILPGPGNGLPPPFFQ